MSETAKYRTWLSDIIPSLKEIRHEIHKHPEVSGHEKGTSKKIISFLNDLNPDKMIIGIGGEGLIAQFKGQKKGPTILFRSELDALPIQETCDIPYKSITDKVSHKCGHDGHMAILLGLSKIISHHRPEKGDILILFQPAEETGEGAQCMLDDEKMEQFHPDYVFALHNIPKIPKNKIISRTGIFSSASTGLIIRLKGMTSHASHPENGRNPVLAMTHIIEHLLTLPQMATSFEEAALVTIIHARLGEIAFGTSPGYAEVMATLRSHKNVVLEELCKEAEELAEVAARLNKLDVEVKRTQKFEATMNDEQCVRWIEKAAESISTDYDEMDQPFSWSEDFGRFTGKYRGAMFGLGSGEEQPQLHHSDYDFPDDIIETGVLMFLNIVEQVVNSSE